jgi:hypothetical protein
MKPTVALLLAALAAGPLSATTLSDLSWIAGHWSSRLGEAVIEEIWTEPAGGVMLGMHREIRPGSRAMFEFLRIEEREGTITYIAQPGGKPPTPFPLSSIEGEKVTFENPDHDWPNRIIYWKEGDSLCARVEANMGGKADGEEWCWEKR